MEEIRFLLAHISILVAIASWFAFQFLVLLGREVTKELLHRLMNHALAFVGRQFRRRNRVVACGIASARASALPATARVTEGFGARCRKLLRRMAR